MEIIKTIIAAFIKKQPEEIGNDTVIDRTAVKGSILIHRMYAEIARSGITIEKYADIRTYGDLINKINPGQVQVIDSVSNSSEMINRIGIDLEKIDNFPGVADFREDPFYNANFSQYEIAYCSLKKHPLQSFAGLFCAKEAICKTNDKFRSIPFHQIEILHSPEGLPVFPGYALSIAHTDDAAISVAQILEHAQIEEKPDQYDRKIENELENKLIQKSEKKDGFILGLAALIIALIALAISIIN